MVFAPVILRTLQTEVEQQPIRQSCFHRWTLPNGRHWALFYRREDDYLVRFPQLGDFTVAPDAQRIALCAVPGVAADVLEHLYSNLVIPLVLSHQNKLVLHASAVEIDDYSVVFAAASGRGKSTLAASFTADGHRFLTDDGAQLEQDGVGYLVRSNNPLIRLWGDSTEGLAFGSNSISRIESSSGKFMILDKNMASFCEDPRPLKAVYFLGDGDTESVSLTAISGGEAIVNLLGNSFLLDVAGRDTLARHFERISLLARAPIFFRLDYPRRYDVLSEVRARVIRHTRHVGAR